MHAYKNITNTNGDKSYKNFLVTASKTFIICKHLKIKIANTVQIYQTSCRTFPFQRCWVQWFTTLWFAPDLRTITVQEQSLSIWEYCISSWTIQSPWHYLQFQWRSSFWLLFPVLVFLIFTGFDVSNPTDQHRWPNFHP